MTADISASRFGETQDGGASPGHPLIYDAGGLSRRQSLDELLRFGPIPLNHLLAKTFDRAVVDDTAPIDADVMLAREVTRRAVEGHLRL